MWYTEYSLGTDPVSVMSAHDSPKASQSPRQAYPQFGSRRESLVSISGTTHLDKETLAQALDDIHVSARQSGGLTTFNEFAAPPSSTEAKGLAGELMHNGLSGLYNRFRGAVSAGSKYEGSPGAMEDGASHENAATKSQIASTPSVMARRLNGGKDGTGLMSSPSLKSTKSTPVSRLQSPTTSTFTLGAPALQSPGVLQADHSSRGSGQIARSSSSASRPPIAPLSKATPSTIVVPQLAPINVGAFTMKQDQVPRLSTDPETRGVSFKEDVFGSTKSPNLPVPGHIRNRSIGDRVAPDEQGFSSITTRADSWHIDIAGKDMSHRSSEASDDRRTNRRSLEVFGGGDSARDVVSGLPKLLSPAVSSLQASEGMRNNKNDARPIAPEVTRRLPAMDRVGNLYLPGYRSSRGSSTDRSIVEASPINASAHGGNQYGLSSLSDGLNGAYAGRKYIPGTTTNEGDPVLVNTKLEQMRKQVLSKEFWMADEICKECFLCGDSFSAFRRKHHCRTCGCIFDSKCTSIISGQRFGVQGSLRVCKTCLDIINRRHDSSGSEESGDDEALSASFFHPHHPKIQTSEDALADAAHGNSPATKGGPCGDGDGRPFATPMMAIPATRRVGDSANRRSAVLEIDAPQLSISRPGSSRSLKSLSTSRPASSGHRRLHSKHNLLSRFKQSAESRAPFQRGVVDETSRRTKLPAFHDDNIIDPDLAPYMSDDGSSGDEQMSIFAAMNSNGTASGSLEKDRLGFGSLLSAAKKHRSRAGDKLMNSVGYTNRSVDDGASAGLSPGHIRPIRRRNMSAVSIHMHHSRGPSRQNPEGSTQDPSELEDDITDLASPGSGKMISSGPPQMIRSISMRDTKAPAVELNAASLHHVRRLLRQLLQDADIPNVSSWEKALVPILLRCTDDVNPDVRRGDDLDIRHYVKLKKIPGGRPGDTSYVSGVVFTKNLAFKSMPRSIAHPRIVIVSFPIEYQRHQQHFMSLEPVIAQEKDFLRNMVNRIASLRPQLLLVQKHISGLALQYLAEANIAVAYNVKQSVIEAVSRCAQTEIISSIDMVALKPVHVGKSASFDVKTYVHNDIPGKRKTCLYLSGCPKELGCTIVLRGANIATLSKMKRITEFMVYVVYNLKLETCLFRDEFVQLPSAAVDSGSLSPSNPLAPTAMNSTDPDSIPAGITITEPSGKVPAVSDTANDLEAHQSSGEGLGPHVASVHVSNADIKEYATSDEPDLSPSQVDHPRFMSAQESQMHSHTNGSSEDPLPEDVPMPTFYSDVVAKHQTKILSASPFVKFMQPYLLMRAREQERRLVYLKRLRDQDTFEELAENEKAKPQRFQLIRPEMVHETVRGAPKQIMEVLHAVHDAEYDKALHNYQTQKRQWEIYIQGNLNLFDPYSHQNIVVLHTVVCTATTVPCTGPDLLALAFYNQHETSSDFDPDCTLGQYVEDLCLSANTVCASNGCERRMSEHHRTYVHGEARITVFIENSPCKLKGLQDSILMWSYCKICKKETQVMPMSESTWKYSLGKYLELSFWSSELRLRAGFCPHDIHRDHLRYFGYRNVAIRIHYDPIDLLEIVVPRARVTWKVDNDLRLKNELFTKTEERWNRFMASVMSRIKGINVDSVVPEKVEACKAEVENLTNRASDEHAALIHKLQDKYMESKYYEIIPLNRAVRAMQEKVAEWDTTFADFDDDFFPSEKDIRRLAALQLKKMFMDRDESTNSLVSVEGQEGSSDVDEKSPETHFEAVPEPSQILPEEENDALSNIANEQPSALQETLRDNEEANYIDEPEDSIPQHAFQHDQLLHLDLALPAQASHPSQEDNCPQELGLRSQSAISTDTRDSFDPMISPGITANMVDVTLSQKVELLRRASQEARNVQAESSGIPRPADRASTRQTLLATSPPLSRTHSQPVATLRRLGPLSKKSFGNRADPMAPELESLQPAMTEPTKPTDKKLSERLGLNTLKGRGKSSHSLIPRSINSKRNESKVSTLAKHFEQLSREFEKERLRDRKQRAAKVTQSRAFPKASSKPIVEVYKDVNEAVEERGPSDDDIQNVEPSHPNAGLTSVISDLAKLDEDDTAAYMAPHPSTETTLTTEGTATEVETEDNQALSQTASDDEANTSDVEHSLLDDIQLPGTESLAESLDMTEPSNDGQLELPKHEKSSLMKMLTNFWAERSASGWTQLEYPLNASDHVFVDSDVIVREDEPSSLIAFALSSEDYLARLDAIRQQGHAKEQANLEKNGNPKLSDSHEVSTNEAEVETSLLRATGTHLKYTFAEGSAKMLCKIFYAEQFDAVRRKCGVSDRIVESLSRCLKWDSKGGKTKSVFLKTLDDRLVLKSLSPIETQAFLRFAPAYFNIMAEALFHDLPTVIAKMLGFYQIVIKNPVTGTEIKWDVLIMENLFYDRSPTRIFDLKGSMRNRKIQSTGEQNEVLLDENMVEFIYESPLFAREHSKKLLRASVWNDTLFLARQNVMDYSLMVAVDEARKELVVGIIDCIRTYTWDKKLESWIKDRGFAGGGRNRPTVTSPKEYKSRFREAMARYVLQAPK